MSSRRCTHCGDFLRDKSDKHYIGWCQRYGRHVIDALCGCEQQADKIILWNFEEGKDEDAD